MLTVSFKILLYIINKTIIEYLINKKILIIIINIDLRPLKLWPVLLDVFTSTTEPEIKMYIAWIFGTSVQNNETAQKDVNIVFFFFLKYIYIYIIMNIKK